MAEDKLDSSAADDGVREAISAFEQILEALPNDRLALETLIEAYEQLGEHDKALTYLLRLAHIVAEEADPEAIPAVAEKLQKLGAEHDTAREMLKQLARVSSPEEKQAPAKPVETAPRKTVDIAAELALAWNLAQAGEISQEDYANVAHDLSENTMKNVVTPVTVQHALADRGFKNMDKVLRFMAVNSGMPIIPLGSFDLQREAAGLLPLDFMTRRAAVVFDLMGHEALVALLNPYDTELREEVLRRVGRPCHFFLTTAHAYDLYLERLAKALQQTPPPA